MRRRLPVQQRQGFLLLCGHRLRRLRSGRRCGWCVVGCTAVGGGWTGGEVAGMVGRSVATGSLAGGAVGASVATGVWVGGANVAAGGASVTGSLQATETASRARIDNIFGTVLITLFPEPPKTGKPPNFQKLSIPLPANARTKYKNYTLALVELVKTLCAFCRRPRLRNPVQ